MILEFKIKNFLSFKDEVCFSFKATKDKYLEDSHVVEIAPGVRILKLCVVYGANASGKSNLINAFEYLHDFWFSSTDSKDDETNVVPFLLDTASPNEPSEFTIIFYANEKKFIYNLVIDKKNVISEKLIYYPGIQPLEIFLRKLNNNVSEINFNKEIKISSAAKKEISAKCLSNMSLFAAYNKVNVSVPILEIVITWMKKQFMASVEPDVLLEKYTEDMIMKDNSIKDYILHFLTESDFNITDFKTIFEDKPVPENVITFIMNSDVPNEEKERLKKDRTIKVTKTQFKHKVFDENGDMHEFELPSDLQSKGTLRTMGISGVMKNAIKENAFIAIDEIESSLHPKLVEFFIENFLIQSRYSQLLITTHYDGLLEEEDLLRNDNIWFTNKKMSGSTELYSLSDFKGVNRITSLQKAYKYGKFGAVPNI